MSEYQSFSDYTSQNKLRKEKTSSVVPWKYGDAVCLESKYTP